MIFKVKSIDEHFSNENSLHNVHEQNSSWSINERDLSDKREK